MKRRRLPGLGARAPAALRELTVVRGFVRNGYHNVIVVRDVRRGDCAGLAGLFELDKSRKQRLARNRARRRAGAPSFSLRCLKHPRVALVFTNARAGDGDARRLVARLRLRGYEPDVVDLRRGSVVVGPYLLRVVGGARGLSLRIDPAPAPIEEAVRKIRLLAAKHADPHQLDLEIRKVLWSVARRFVYVNAGRAFERVQREADKALIDALAGALKQTRNQIRARFVRPIVLRRRARPRGPAAVWVSLYKRPSKSNRRPWQPFTLRAVRLRRVLISSGGVGTDRKSSSADTAANAVEKFGAAAARVNAVREIPVLPSPCDRVETASVAHERRSGYADKVPCPGLQGGQGVRKDASPYVSDGFPCRDPKGARVTRGAPSQSEKPTASVAGNRGGYEAGEPTSCREHARARRIPRGNLGFYAPTGTDVEVSLDAGQARLLDAPGAMTIHLGGQTCDWSGLRAAELAPATQAFGCDDPRSPDEPGEDRSDSRPADGTSTRQKAGSNLRRQGWPGAESPREARVSTPGMVPSPERRARSAETVDPRGRTAEASVSHETLRGHEPDTRLIVHVRTWMDHRSYSARTLTAVGSEPPTDRVSKSPPASPSGSSHTALTIRFTYGEGGSADAPTPLSPFFHREAHDG